MYGFFLVFLYLHNKYYILQVMRVPKTLNFGYNKRISSPFMESTQTLSPTPALLSWEAPTHHSFERSTKWYLVAGGIVAIVAIVAVLTGNWSLALVSILAAGLYFLVRDHRFPNEKIELNEQGVRIGDAFAAWTELQGYWFLYTNDYTEVHFVPTARKPDLKIQTGTTNDAAIRQAIATRIPELFDKKEHLVDAFIRICRL